MARPHLEEDHLAMYTSCPSFKLKRHISALNMDGVCVFTGPLRSCSQCGHSEQISFLCCFSLLLVCLVGLLRIDC